MHEYVKNVWLSIDEKIKHLEELIVFAIRFSEVINKKNIVTNKNTTYFII